MIKKSNYYLHLYSLNSTPVCVIIINENYSKIDLKYLEDPKLGELMQVINNSESPADGAKKWIEDNQYLFNQWVK